MFRIFYLFNDLLLFCLIQPVFGVDYAPKGFLQVLYHVQGLANFIITNFLYVLGIYLFIHYSEVRGFDIEASYC